jgi:formylglycine-generating enzyme required for sulfatase activity
MVAALIIFGRDPTPKQSRDRTASDAELAAFQMAKSLDTQAGWTAYLQKYQDGELAPVARGRLQQAQIREKENLKAAAEVPPPALKPKTDVAASIAPARPRLSGFMETLVIPGGVFVMGNDAGKGDEKPQHQVRLDAFRMGRAEVTNRQYLAFLEDTGYARPRDPAFSRNYLLAYPDLPVLNVNYDDAVAFCKWASRKYGVSVRLPTEAEWEYAARGPKGFPVFPWSAADAKSRARYKDNAPREVPTVAAGAFPANAFGLLNMNGNVWEWTSDYYSKDYYKVSPVKNPAGPATGAKRVIRGGSWADDETQLASPRRASRDPKDHSDQIGFRIVIEKE